VKYIIPHPHPRLPNRVVPRGILPPPRRGWEEKKKEETRKKGKREEKRKKEGKLSEERGSF